jgi:hypothetical protein
MYVIEQQLVVWIKIGTQVMVLTMETIYIL